MGGLFNDAVLAVRCGLLIVCMYVLDCGYATIIDSYGLLL